jgi:tRNA threonylcarbamoyladenosine biosynthesis protein TsaB
MKHAARLRFVGKGMNIDFSDKNVLGVDASSSALRLGLRFGGERMVKSSEDVQQSHGMFIIKKINELFGSAGLQIADLDGIAVVTGPGSFTGLRVGISAVKGLAVASDIPVAGVNLFEIAAHKLARFEEPTAVVVPFKKDTAFVCTVCGGRFDPDTIAPVKYEALSDFVNDMPVVGMNVDLSSVAPSLSQALDSSLVKFDATEAIYLGTEKLSAGQNDNLAELEPMYIQKSQAEIKFDQRHKQ